VKRTLYRLQTRFFWPGLVCDATYGVTRCAHCNLANAVNMENQAQIETLSCDEPFDCVFLDIWSPGDSVVNKYGDVKVLTYICCMTGFAAGTFLKLSQVNSQTVAMAAFSQFFIPYGLPCLIIVDADKMFQKTFLDLFRILQVPVEAVSAENHKAVRNERFHRYLNKVERINSADQGSLDQWRQGVLFGLYAWNAGPIDGT
jgi:hypothetical protein